MDGGRRTRWLHFSVLCGVSSNDYHSKEKQMVLKYDDVNHSVANLIWNRGLSDG